MGLQVISNQNCRYRILYKSFKSFLSIRNYYENKLVSPLVRNHENISNNISSLEIPTVPLKYNIIDRYTSLHISKSPIIILHGLFGNKLNNRSIARLLNKSLERNIYSLDLRNHGESPHIKPHDYSSMAADVERWIKEHNFKKKPIIIGHSMGAKVAMSIPLRNHNICSMIVSIDNAPVVTSPLTSFLKYVSKLLEISNNPNIETIKQADDILKNIEHSPLVRQFLLTVLKKCKDDTTGKYMFKPIVPLEILRDSIIKGNISNWDFDSSIHRWTGPALFIRGIQSDYVADEFIADIGKTFPNFELKDIDASHWVNTENPKECADLITDFIEKHEDE